ncbi:DUF5597 domain-containing protein [Leifsonia sp. NPDC058292]|uniref:DUF5597 domain-containing protein n=1 Tax=Leifsonia sp. NPDC058292 TaxID=3346428 RepID=UPI0036DB2E6B
MIDGELIVEGKPFRILGAEIHNSSSSTPKATAESFKRVASLGANTVLAPIAWESIEPVEGEFDFTLATSLLDEANANGLKLIPLWFGSWKNGMSSYVPGWVKKDTVRFPRAATAATGHIEHLTPFAAEVGQADARAFAALMGHFAAHDQAATIVMVQVENEAGLLGDSRDRSELAEGVWSEAVPERIAEAAQAQSGSHTWRGLFGDRADEAMMAYGYASSVEVVAAAGRRQFDVPMIVNAWLDAIIDPELPALASETIAVAGGAAPGDYPSGGPLSHTATIWRAIAPSIDLISPDIYFGPFDKTCTDFKSVSDALFIPEMRRSAVGVAQMFRAIGEHGAIGVSPFGVDSLRDDEKNFRRLRDAFGLLKMASELLAAPYSGVRGFFLSPERPRETFTFGEFAIQAIAGATFFSETPEEPAYGLLIEIEPTKFVAIGRGFSLTFSAGSDVGASLLHADERVFEEGHWQTVRRLNGDESGSGSFIRFPALEEAYEHPIVAFNTRLTGVVAFELYTFDR